MQLCVYPYDESAPKFTVVRQAICATKMGFAGYAEVQTPDGTLIQVVGRYDNEYEQTETEMAHVAEHIWVNGNTANLTVKTPPASKPRRVSTTAKISWQLYAVR